MPILNKIKQITAATLLAQADSTPSPSMPALDKQATWHGSILFNLEKGENINNKSKTKITPIMRKPPPNDVVFSDFIATFALSNWILPASCFAALSLGEFADKTKHLEIFIYQTLGL